MKRLSFSGVTTLVLASALLSTGCVGFSVGGGTKSQSQPPTLGQQLVDLKRARDAGAISESEYEMQRARLLQAH